VFKKLEERSAIKSLWLGSLRVRELLYCNAVLSAEISLFLLLALVISLGLLGTPTFGVSL